MADQTPPGRRELLHQLRNRLNVMGFALYALRADTSKPMEVLRNAHQSASALVNQLGEEERALQQARHAAAEPVPLDDDNR